MLDLISFMFVILGSVLIIATSLILIIDVVIRMRGRKKWETVDIINIRL